jgi:hypothetical protein
MSAPGSTRSSTSGWPICGVSRGPKGHRTASGMRRNIRSRCICRWAPFRKIGCALESSARTSEAGLVGRCAILRRSLPVDRGAVLLSDRDRGRHRRGQARLPEISAGSDGHELRRARVDRNRGGRGSLVDDWPRPFRGAAVVAAASSLDPGLVGEFNDKRGPSLARTAI